MDTQVTQGRGFRSRPKKLSSVGLKKLINRAIWVQGLRKKLENGKKRHHFKQSIVLENGLKLDVK